MCILWIDTSQQESSWHVEIGIVLNIKLHGRELNLFKPHGFPGLSTLLISFAVFCWSIFDSSRCQTALRPHLGASKPPRTTSCPLEGERLRTERTAPFHACGPTATGIPFQKSVHTNPSSILRQWSIVWRGGGLFHRHDAAPSKVNSTGICNDLQRKTLLLC